MTILNHKPQALLLSGLPASGKTNEALRWVGEDPDGRVRINYDDLRLGMFGPDWKFNRKDENQMKAHADSIARKALNAGLSIVVDNTSLTSRAKSHWRNLAKSMAAEVIEQEIDTPVAECVHRDRTRDKRVGRAVIERMALWHGFVDWKDTTLYPKPFIVVDMDGTLADCEWRRKFINPTMEYECESGCKSTELQRLNRGCQVCGAKPPSKDYDSFYANVIQDPPIQPIIQLVQHLYHHYDVLIVSGRPQDRAGIQTEDWIYKHLPGIQIKHLFMRNGGDFRDDSIVKEEILELLPKNRIAYVLDDRDRVVEMWRRNGLTTLQVAKGDF